MNSFYLNLIVMMVCPICVICVRKVSALNIQYLKWQLAWFLLSPLNQDAQSQKPVPFSFLPSLVFSFLFFTLLRGVTSNIC